MGMMIGMDPYLGLETAGLIEVGLLGFMLERPTRYYRRRQKH